MMSNVEHAGLAYWVPPTKLGFASKLLEVPQKQEDLPSRESTCDEWIDDWHEAASTDPCPSEETSGDEASSVRLALPPGLQPSTPMVNFTCPAPPPGLDCSTWHQGVCTALAAPPGQSRGTLARNALREKGDALLQAIAHGPPANDGHRRANGRRKNGSAAKAQSAKKASATSSLDKKAVGESAPMKVDTNGLSTFSIPKARA
mmetsp:Transcript_66866/g.105779  ORF Transcript_66866/g.105779 Transcript_66866/m.105779 type:complete len:203 (-) Transcript_66866:163-771(-)